MKKFIILANLVMISVLVLASCPEDYALISEEIEVPADAVMVSGDTLITGNFPATLKAEDFPAEWGKIVSAVATVTANEDRTDWGYTWSIHFENGTLPVIVEKNAISATMDLSLFEYDTNSKLNGAVYSRKTNVWKNSVAYDQGGIMLWFDTNEIKQYSLLMSTAAKWGWNNGTNSVFTDAFSFSAEDDGTKLVVKKGGTVFFTGTIAAE